MLITEVQIATVLEKKLFSIRPASQGDLYTQCGRRELLKQLQAFIHDHQPIRFLLPAFPCKSPNREKVTGRLPDAAEFYALDELNQICKEIQSIHPPGCELMIWSDGRVFGDLVGVSEEEITMYEDLLRSFTSTMPHLQWDNLTNYVNHGDQLIETYGSPTFDFSAWLQQSENHYQHFLHLRKFMETDSGKRSHRINLSRRQLQHQMSGIAEQMIKRNEALSNLLRLSYPKHIRLSIHQHVNNGEKFTIGFFREQIGEANTQSFLRTPWHNALVIHLDGQKRLLPSKMLNQKTEYLPIMFNNRIWCFVQFPSSSIHSTLKLSLLNRRSPRMGLSIDSSQPISLDQLDVNWIQMLLKVFRTLHFPRQSRLLNEGNYPHVFSPSSMDKSNAFHRSISVPEPDTPFSYPTHPYSRLNCLRRMNSTQDKVSHYSTVLREKLFTSNNEPWLHKTIEEPSYFCDTINDLNLTKQQQVTSDALFSSSDNRKREIIETGLEKMKAVSAEYSIRNDLDLISMNKSS